MRIAIVKLSALGDIVHAMVVLQFIKNFDNEISIDWIVENSYKDILSNHKNFGINKNEDKKKYLVEFVSANPTGPLHVGHCRGAILGDVISNILKFNEHKVSKEYYVNDAGRQISILTSSVILNAYVENFESEGTYEGDYIKGLADDFRKKHGELDKKITFSNSYNEC